MSIVKNFEIAEYTILEFDSAVEGSKYYKLKLGDNLYYQSADMPQLVVVDDIGNAAHITGRNGTLDTLKIIGFLQNFYDKNGMLREDNKGKTIEPLAGVAEAAEILGWDKRKFSTYLGRGVLPEPIQRLASGPIWTRKQIEDYRDARS